MVSFDDIVAQHGVRRVELEAWIERQWVRPRRDGRAYVFDEVDSARVALIVELRRDLSIDEDALALVLSLLDQLYAARQVLHSVEGALEALPDSVREQVRDALRRPPER